MRISNNIMAMNTHRQYAINNDNVAKATEKLSSGYRINRAGDDAAGLAISEKMRAQIRGLQMASKNSQDAISLVQTAEGALTETHSILQRMRELAVQSASDTNEGAVDRAALDAEFQQLSDEIDDIADKTAFNGKKLLDGSFGTNVTNGIKSATTGTEAQLDALKSLASTVNFTATSSMAAGGYYISSYAALDGTANTSATFDVTDGTNTYSVHAGPDVDGSEVNFALDTNYNIVDDATGDVVGTIRFASNDPVDTAGELSTELTDTTGDYQSLQFTVDGAGAKFQTGANAGDELSLTISDMSASALHITDLTKISTRDDASASITTIENAINQVSTQRAKLGATQNRLQHKINNLDTSAENLQAAESRIRDLDMAAEMTEYTKNNILVQAATAMLAQANSAPQGVLQLLK